MARQPVHQSLLAMLIITICAPVNAKDTKGRKNWFYFAEATTTAIIVWGADSNNPCSAYSVCIHSTIRPSRGRIPAKLGIKYKIIASSPFKFFPDSFQYRSLDFISSFLSFFLDPGHLSSVTSFWTSCSLHHSLPYSFIFTFKPLLASSWILLYFFRPFMEFILPSVRQCAYSLVPLLSYCPPPLLNTILPTLLIHPSIDLM